MHAKDKSFMTLFSRGFDSKLIESLLSQGYNLSSLKKLTRDKLSELGLNDKLIKIIQKESRPPVKEPIVYKLLYESKWTCCICRCSDKSVIIHHIIPWSISKDNSEENLAVLCLEDHDKAHTKKEISSNLTPAMIMDAKLRWTNTVKNADINTSKSPHNIIFNKSELISVFALLLIDENSPGNVQDWFAGAEPDSPIDWETIGTAWDDDLGSFRKGSVKITINGKPLYKLEKQIVPANWNITLKGARGFFSKFELRPEIITPHLNHKDIIKYFEENGSVLKLINTNKTDFGSYQKELFEMKMPNKKVGYLSLEYEYAAAGCNMCIEYYYFKPDKEKWKE